MKGTIIMNNDYSYFDFIDMKSVFLIIFIGIAIVCLIAWIAFCIYTILKSPFSYPYFIKEFKVTGKRKPNIKDLLFTRRSLKMGKTYLNRI